MLLLLVFLWACPNHRISWDSCTLSEMRSRWEEMLRGLPALTSKDLESPLMRWHSIISLTLTGFLQILTQLCVSAQVNSLQVFISHPHHWPVSAGGAVLPTPMDPQPLQKSCLFSDVHVDKSPPRCLGIRLRHFCSCIYSHISNYKKGKRNEKWLMPPWCWCNSITYIFLTKLWNGLCCEDLKLFLNFMHLLH